MNKQSFATNSPELVKEWHPTKNGVLTPYDVSPFSDKIVWWKCPKGNDHEWAAAIKTRSKGHGCGVCAARVVVKSNCLATLKPELAKEWHPTKNGKLTPYDVIPGSYKKVWWKCPMGDDHEWESAIEWRSNGSGCLICSNRTVVKSNCLATLKPEIAKEWHSDISTPENKATNIGYILFAISLGFMVGPVLAGTLSNSNLVSWFEITTPLYFAAALSLINIIFLQLVFKETFIPKERKAIKLLSGLTVFISAFTVPGLRRLTFAFLFLQLGWSTFVQFVSLFLTLQYHFSANQVGIFMGCVGAGFTLAFCYLLNIVTKLFPLKRIALTSVSLMSLMMLAIVIINNELSAWLISVPAATGLALSFTVLTTMFSNSVSSEKQGWIMGLTGAIGAFSFGITGLGAGFIANLGASAPIWVAFILLTISALVISTLANISKG